MSDVDAPPALGLVLDAGRGSLPFALLHGESLVAIAAWSLGASGVTPVDTGVGWVALVGAEEPLVLHDPLCPLTPPDFIAACVVRALETDAVVVGVRPVTDTVKAVHEQRVGETLDRDSLAAVASPLVLPPSVAAALPELPPALTPQGLSSIDLADLVDHLRAAGHPVELLEAPAQARRVADTDGLLLLEALNDER